MAPPHSVPWETKSISHGPVQKAAFLIQELHSTVPTLGCCWPHYGRHHYSEILKYFYLRTTIAEPLKGAISISISLSLSLSVSLFLFILLSFLRPHVEIWDSCWTPKYQVFLFGPPTASQFMTQRFQV